MPILFWIFFVNELSFKIANMRQMSMYGREHPSPEVEKGQWIEYCRREERIQKYMCQKNGQEGFLKNLCRKKWRKNVLVIIYNL